MTAPRRPSPFAAGFLAAIVLATIGLATGFPASADDPSARPGRGVERGDGAAGSSGRAGRDRARGQAVPPPNSLPGIDVSHHQDTIDWTQVAASGIRFVFQKASEGTGYVDPTYATNRAAATANGLVFGAYHFARPDLHPFDPVPEADHFVDTAQLGQGDLFPVLDLERSGDLSQAELTAWIIGWLDRVYERTGIRPIVYTSPNGWKSRTGDSTAVADAGYATLLGRPLADADADRSGERLAGVRLDVLAVLELREHPRDGGLRGRRLVRRVGPDPVHDPVARHRRAGRLARYPHGGRRPGDDHVQRDRPRRDAGERRGARAGYRSRRPRDDLRAGRRPGRRSVASGASW